MLCNSMVAQVQMTCCLTSIPKHCAVVQVCMEVQTWRPSLVQGAHQVAFRVQKQAFTALRHGRLSTTAEDATKLSHKLQLLRVLLMLSQDGCVHITP